MEKRAINFNIINVGDFVGKKNGNGINSTKDVDKRLEETRMCFAILFKKPLPDRLAPNTLAMQMGAGEIGQVPQKDKTSEKTEPKQQTKKTDNEKEKRTHEENADDNFGRGIYKPPLGFLGC